MLRVLFDFVVDTRSNPLGTGTDSRPSQKKTKERGTHCVSNAGKIKSLGRPPIRFPYKRNICQRSYSIIGVNLPHDISFSAIGDLRNGHT
jgi:hypothetical protein